jgi:hypothetical protein
MLSLRDLSMNRRLALFSTLLALSLVTVTSQLFSWGFWAHREITRYAIRSLPAEMGTFFTANAESLIARSVEPDNRRYVDSTEGYHHYIDIDRYGTFPFEELPRSYDEAVEKFGKTTVDTNGRVPWRIVEFTGRLSAAMKRGDRNSIIFFASNLSHYIADAHVPLHTTENYDGQFTNQKGIHARWESRIPERYGKGFNLQPAEVEHIADQLDHAFRIVLESFPLVDSVLQFDRQVREGMKDSEAFRRVERRGRTEFEFSDAYYARYYELVGPSVRRRMQDSVRRVASFWYTAWVDAGKPELPAR